jgi:pimeloyl-ACP methyl ester carboxylesterase
MLGLGLSRLTFLCVASSLALGLTGCSLFKTTCEEDDRECIGPGPGLGVGLGRPCSITADCKENLVCENGVCRATGGIAQCQNRDEEQCTEADDTFSVDGDGLVTCDTKVNAVNPPDDEEDGDLEPGEDDDNTQVLCTQACFEACEKCRLTVDCSMVDYCGSRRVCLLAGDGAVGAACEDTGDCRRGLVCQLPELTDQGTLSLNELATLRGSCEQSGNGEQGDPCQDITDCLAGLFCAEFDVGESRKVCTNLPTPIPANYSAELPPLPEVWAGVDCEEDDPDAPKIARFVVPRANVDLGEDFYSLPFPNDIRVRASGKIDLGGHPVPPEAIGVPFINRYAEVAQEDLEGFSTNAVAILRFSHAYDFGTVGPDNAMTAGNDATVRLIDITPGSPTYNTEQGIAWKETRGTLSSYVCPHWVGIARPLGNPFLPNTTYAAIVTTGVKAENGDDFERDADFEAMLGGSQPGDDELAAAWQAYAPLRAWIDAENEDEGEILNAAVFTTSDPESLIRGLRQRVMEDGPATLSDLTNCSEAGAVSPCETTEEDGSTRGACVNRAGQDFTEIHARISLPIFQNGVLPYVSEGGGIELDAQGLPTIVTHQDVCMAISVPNAAPPAGGYPVLIYSHGTGGSFTNTMGSNSNLASDLATAATPTAVVAIDLPQHGERRGTGEDSKQDPDGLFYNFLNPRAARDNVAQGSADLFGIVQWIMADGGLDAIRSPTGSAVVLDTARIMMMGHSQGATHTALMVSHEPNVKAVVLSGVGGHLTSSLLTKTSPVDIAAVIPIGLQDPDSGFRLAAGIFNPALAIIQSVFDPVDPINYARHLRREILASNPGGQHTFVTYGVGDTFSPEKTQLAYLVAAQLPFVTPILSEPSDIPDFDGTMVQLLAPPLSGNDNFGAGPRTIGTRQYAPRAADLDGHFVATRPGEDGRADVIRFLEEAAAGQAPSIGP